MFVDVQHSSVPITHSYGLYFTTTRLSQENVSNGTVLFTLTAEDPDEGENGTVEYSVINTDSPDTSQGQDFFAIDSSTGQVKVHTSLVGHPGEHNVTFMARDKGSPPLNSTTSVVVLVNDVNMNAPVFVVPDQRLTNVSAGIVQNITIDEVFMMSAVSSSNVLLLSLVLLLLLLSSSSFSSSSPSSLSLL